MKKSTPVMHQFTVTASVLSAIVAGSPVLAQSVSPTLARAAEAACIESAESKGFSLNEIVSVEPKPATTDGAIVVLNLNRDGQPFKLTCGYTESEGAMFDGNEGIDIGANLPTYRANLWWLLLPLIGLPLLLWWAAGRRQPAHAYVSDQHTETVVKSQGQTVQTHSGPGYNFSVTGTLYDGQHVQITGRQQQDWTELVNGNWVPTAQLALGSRYAAR